MPEPGYASDDPPGFWGCVFGFIVLFALFFLVKGCL
jgi:hypothetical protein